MQLSKVGGLVRCVWQGHNLYGIPKMQIKKLIRSGVLRVSRWDVMVRSKKRSVGCDSEIKGELVERSEERLVTRFEARLEVRVRGEVENK